MSDATLPQRKSALDLAACGVAERGRGRCARCELLQSAGGKHDSPGMRKDAAELKTTLRANPAFAGWPAPALEALAARCRSVWLEPGQELSGQNALGPCSYLVQSGWLTQRYASNAAVTDCTFVLLGRGMMLFDLLPKASSFENLETVVTRSVGLIEISSDALRNAMEVHPGRWGDLMLCLLDQEQTIFSCVVGQLTGSVSQRVAQTVLQYANLLGDRIEGTPGVDLNLSQDELGSLLHLSRTTVGRELGALESAGLIDRRYGHIRVSSIQGLCRFANAASDSISEA